MICPNCGLEQPEGKFCVNCQSVLLAPLSVSDVKALSQSDENKATTPVQLPSPPIEINPKNLDISSPKISRTVPLPGTEQFQKVLVTTTHSIDNQKSFRYGDLICCQAVAKLDELDEFLAKVQGITSLRNSPYGDLFKKAETLLMTDLKIEAAKKGADAVVGVTIHYEFHWKNAMVVYASGTAVYFENDVDKG